MVVDKWSPIYCRTILLHIEYQLDRYGMADNQKIVDGIVLVCIYNLYAGKMFHDVTHFLMQLNVTGQITVVIQ